MQQLHGHMQKKSSFLYLVMWIKFQSHYPSPMFAASFVKLRIFLSRTSQSTAPPSSVACEIDAVSGAIICIYLSFLDSPVTHYSMSKDGTPTLPFNLYIYIFIYNVAVPRLNSKSTLLLFSSHGVAPITFCVILSCTKRFVTILPARECRILSQDASKPPIHPRLTA